MIPLRLMSVAGPQAPQLFPMSNIRDHDPKEENAHEH
jgi:hypothetical protein